LSDPEKITSSPFLPRSVFILCSPRAQRTDSATFYFPEPFGPTTEVIPLLVLPSIPGKMSEFLLANDLNPCISNFSKNIFVHLNIKTYKYLNIFLVICLNIYMLR